MTKPPTLADRFRTWYTYECDCNAKALKMLTNTHPLIVSILPSLAEFPDAVN